MTEITLINFNYLFYPHDNTFQVLFALVVAEASLLVASKTFQSDEELEQWLHNTYEKNASELCTKQVFAEWAYNTDVNNPTAQEEAVLNLIRKTCSQPNANKFCSQIAVSVEAAEIKKAYWEEYFKNISVEDIKNDTIKREIVSLKTLGDSVLPSDKLQQVC